MTWMSIPRPPTSQSDQPDSDEDGALRCNWNSVRRTEVSAGKREETIPSFINSQASRHKDSNNVTGESEIVRIYAIWQIYPGMPAEIKLEVALACQIIESLGGILVTKLTTLNDKQQVKAGYWLLIKTWPKCRKILLLFKLSITSNIGTVHFGTTARQQRLAIQVTVQPKLDPFPSLSDAQHVVPIKDGQCTMACQPICKSYNIQRRNILPYVAQHWKWQRTEKLQTTRANRFGYEHNEGWLKRIN